ncbi:MAG: hypothetical protein OXH88_00265 [Gammaproteobacteria bacterium]|nr:hypothetical protein [Gammaproteobacteria bacterium]
MHPRQSPGQLAQSPQLPVDGTHRRQAFEALPGLHKLRVLFGNYGQVRGDTLLVEHSYGKTRKA